MLNHNSFKRGREAEEEFIALRGDNFLRRATKQEDIHEHWDILDKEFGRVDVKAAKGKWRNGGIDHTIWWELKTVKRPPKYVSAKGWGVPNGIDRYIAITTEDSFYLVNPAKVIDKLREKCKKFYRGEFGLHTRDGRGDLTTILPLSFLQEYSDHRLERVAT
jgi:hypothetical protein